jgi:hypothetical protein
LLSQSQLPLVCMLGHHPHSSSADIWCSHTQKMLLVAGLF